MKSSESKTFKELIGNNVREIRNKKGLTQYRLSKISGVERSIITKLELGQHLITLNTLLRLTIALDCPIEALVKGFEKFITEDDDIK